MFCIGRFAHASVLLPSGEILVYGGFGCRRDSEAHSRLDDLLIISHQLVGDRKKWLVESQSVQGDNTPGKPSTVTLAVVIATDQTF